MRIELTDRAYWLSRIAEAQAFTEHLRAKRDAEYRRRWGEECRVWNASFWSILFGKRDDSNPGPKKTERGRSVYPSQFGLKYEKRFNVLRDALRNQHTGAIWVDGGMLRLIEEWSKAYRKLYQPASDSEVQTK